MILIGALALIAAIPLQAQSIQTLLAGGTNTIVGAVTNSFVVPVTRSQNIAIQLAVAPHTSGSVSNVLMKIDRSTIAATTSATPLWEQNVFTISLAGTSGVLTNTFVTNLPPTLVGGIGFLRLNLCNTNVAGAASVMTNVWLITSQKPGI